MKDQLAEAFRERFGRSPEVIGEAPGRLEILGNHTDYNDGVVLSGATSRSTFFAAASAPLGGPATVRSMDLQLESCFDPADPGQPIPGDWANYIKGVVVEMGRRELPVAPFFGLVSSTLPMSSGMSSSAALEVSAAFALGHLNQVTLSATDWARIGQGAENNFVGANTGLLDQMSSIMGRADHLVQIDFRSLAVTPLPFPPDVVLVVANSGLKHDLTREYNERRQRCEAAAAFLAERYEGVASLRDVSMAQLEAVRAEMDVLTYRRARHIVGEIENALAGAATLCAGDLVTFGRQLSASHQSSVDNFENSCPELDMLVAIGTSLPGGLGARLSGGGFGGITIHLVEREHADAYAARLATAFESRTGIRPETMICRIGQGARCHV